MYDTVSAGTAVFRTHPQTGELEVLMVMLHGKWGFPKGHVERDESAEDAASREVWEETAIEYELLSYDSVNYDFYSQSDGHKQVRIFIGKYTGGAVDEKGHATAKNWENDVAMFIPVRDLKAGRVKVMKSLRGSIPAILSRYEALISGD